MTTQESRPRSPEPSATKHARILVADDEPRIRLALRVCLESDGYDVLEAADGLEALDAIIHGAPDVMILDLAMPNLDGLRALDAIKGLHGQLKPRVIILTAWGSGPAVLRTMGAGASLFLEKPIVPETLLAAVRSVLAEPPEDGSSGIPIDWSVLLREEGDQPVQ
jgi:two-component system KDP operon response regulator KdpE